MNYRFPMKVMWRVLALAALWSGLILGSPPVTLAERVQQEGIPCAPEPTAMTITYGDLVTTCAIEVVGDSDLFRFTGNTGVTIDVLIAAHSGPGVPCLDLYRPDGSRRIGPVCSASGARIDTTLDQTGTHTVLVTEMSNNETIGEYSVALESLVPPSPTALPLEYGALPVSQDLNPAGDLDLFFFSGSPGDSVVILASVQSGSGTPCLSLFQPDGTLKSGPACSANGARIDTTLDQQGDHALLISESGNNETVAYGVSVQCITGPCVVVSVPDVAGTVQVEGQALAGARVLLRQSGQSNQMTITDENGKYQFETVVDGAFSIFIKGQK